MVDHSLSRMILAYILWCVMHHSLQILWYERVSDSRKISLKFHLASNTLLSHSRPISWAWIQTEAGARPICLPLNFVGIVAPFKLSFTLLKPEYFWRSSFLFLLFPSFPSLRPRYCMKNHFYSEFTISNALWLQILRFLCVHCAIYAPSSWSAAWCLSIVCFLPFSSALCIFRLQPILCFFLNIDHSFLQTCPPKLLPFQPASLVPQAFHFLSTVCLQLFHHPPLQLF